jgi:hypothetical protein
MERIFATPGPVMLTIEIGAGSVSVQATAAAETVVRVEGPRADDVVVEQRGDEIVVLGRDADRGWGAGGGRAPLDVIVTAPIGSNVAAQTGSARVATDGPIGAARIRTGSGDIWVNEVTGESVLDAGSGMVEVGAAAGNLRLKVGSGDVAIGRAAAALEANLGSGSFEVAFVGGLAVLRSGSGDIRVGEAAAALEAATGSGDVSVEQTRRGTIKATTASGDVRIGVPAGVPVWTDIRTLTGEIRSDLRGAGQPAPGQDHLEIRITTSSGDVLLRELVAAADAGAVTIQ